jgi:nitroreductase
MEKLAPVDHAIHYLLRRRWSPRAFSGEEVTKETLLSLFEAARWAPSCFNEQPWSFIVATKNEPEEYQRLLGCLVEFNQSWAKTAPVLMISVAKLSFDQSGGANRHAFHDVGLAVENMIIEAMDKGVFVHQMAGFSPEKARETYGIPATHEPVAAIALGYAGDPEVLENEKARSGESAGRTRKSLASFVFGGKWDKPSGVVAP